MTMPSLLDTGAIFRLKRATGLLDPDQLEQGKTLNPGNLFKPFAPGPAPSPSLSDRMGQKIRGLLGADEMPAGYDALFSAADLNATKQSIPHLLANWILGPSARDETKANLEQMGAARALANSQRMQHEAEAQQKAAQQAQRDWLTQNPRESFPGGDAAFMRSYLASAVAGGWPGANQAGQFAKLYETPPAKLPRTATADGVLYAEQPDGTWVPQTTKTPAAQRKQLVQIPRADGTVDFRWLKEGEAVSGQRPIPAGQTTAEEKKLASDDAVRSIGVLMGPDKKMLPPPSNLDRLATKSDWSNWMASDYGQNYMTNVRKLIRSWAILIEGKRMSDADATVNEALRSFRPFEGAATIEGKKQTLEGMARSIQEHIGKTTTGSASDYDRAFTALGPDATDEQVRAWIKANPRP